jgi:hypothetical protein
MSPTAGSYEVSASPSGARGFSADLPQRRAVSVVRSQPKPTNQ